MNPRPWEVWKAKPSGFERDHWFVILAPPERCAAETIRLVNGLACFSLRGAPRLSEVRLNGADGFDAPTVCQCDFLYPLEKSRLHSRLGAVSWERQQQIKSMIKAVFRL